MRGQAKLTDSLFLVFSTFISVVIFYMIMSGAVSDMVALISLQSSEVVVRDIASFITVTGGAPDEIKIFYTPSDTFTYDLTVTNRTVNIIRLKDGQEVDRSTIFGYQFPSYGSYGKSAVDPEASFTNVNTFTISKFTQDQHYIYSIQGLRD